MTYIDRSHSHTHQECYGCFIIHFIGKKGRKKDKEKKEREPEGGRAGRN